MQDMEIYLLQIYNFVPEEPGLFLKAFKKLAMSI